MSAPRRTVLILGGSADIGHGLAQRYLAEGCAVALTYRRRDAVQDLLTSPNLVAIPCDVSNAESVKSAAQKFASLGLRWNQFISSVGTMEPIGPFFEMDFDSWQESIVVNALGQLRALHALFPYRHLDGENGVMFFAGGGTNNPFRNYSAYAASKIFLIKMAELLDDETSDLNVFVVGPGYVRTKIHDQTLAAGARAGANLRRTLNFFETKGTSVDAVYRCIEWCFAQGRGIAGGRNFSTVGDPWHDGAESFVAELASDPDLCKLRRRPSLLSKRP